MRIFGGVQDTLLQLEIANAQGDDELRKPQPPRKVTEAPPLQLADAIEAELKAGRATTCSEAMRIIASRSPELIDRAADFKQSVESDKLNAEARYFAQVREEQLKQAGTSRQDAMRLVNRKYPAIRQAYVDEVNARQSPLDQRQLSASRIYWTKVREIQRERKLSQSDAMRFVNSHFSNLREDMVRELNTQV
jgi:hypothetical protein